LPACAGCRRRRGSLKTASGQDRVDEPDFPALVDELEQNQAVQRRITVAY
jgi:putative NADH-flavin reductase